MNEPAAEEPKPGDMKILPLLSIVDQISLELNGWKAKMLLLLLQMLLLVLVMLFQKELIIREKLTEHFRSNLQDQK